MPLGCAWNIKRGSCGSESFGTKQAVMQFPRFTARDLEGRTVETPDGLPAAFKLVVLGFQREHQSPMESWQPVFSRLEGEFPGVEVWQVAALPRGYRIFRGAIESGLRAGIVDPRVRRRTLTAYIDVRKLGRDLELPDLRDIRLYLVDGRGGIRWQGRGRFSEATLEALEAALGEATGSA